MTGPRVVVLTDHRFLATPDGRVWTQTQADHDFWSAYAEAWSGVRVVARVAHVSEVPPRHLRADGDGVTFGAVPSFVGLRELARQTPAVLRAVDREVDAAEAVLLRGPGIIALCGLPRLVARRRAYSVEVLGDSYEALRFGGVAGRSGPLLAPLAGWLQRRVCHAARSASYVTDRALQDRYPPGGGPSFAITDVDLPPSAFAPSARPQRPADRPLRMVLVGSLEQPYKGADTAIRMVALLRGQRDCHLTIVGGGRLLDTYRDLALRLGVAESVELTGWLPRGPAVREVLQASDLFVMPSLTEGMPRALLEAMALGLPCVGSEVGDIARLLGAPFTTRPGDPDALARLVVGLGPEELRSMSEHNLRTARAVVSRDTAGLKRQFLETVVASGRQRSPSGAAR